VLILSIEYTKTQLKREMAEKRDLLEERKDLYARIENLEKTEKEKQR